jgi:membrane-associated phospholipid phosphatase
MICRRSAAALLGASIALAQGAPTEIDRPLQLPTLIVGDSKMAWTAPAAWKRDEWTNLSLGALALVGVSIALDRPVDQAFQRTDWTRFDPWAKRLGTLGAEGTVVIAGGAYLTGVLADLPRVRAFGADACLSMFVAEVLATLPAKFIVGRSRPNDENGTYFFKPFHGGQSFPSAHVTQAFTLAAVVSEYGDNAWASAAAYGTASLVGLSRLEQREHFVSDVVAGALIGTLSAKAVMRRHRVLRAGASSHLDVSITPVWTGDSTGLRVAVKF